MVNKDNNYVPGEGVNSSKKPQSDLGAAEEFFSSIRALLQQNGVFIPQAIASLQELQALLERLNASTTGFLNVVGPFVGSKDDMGCTLKVYAHSSKDYCRRRGGW